MPAVSGQFYPGTASGLSRTLLELTREVEAPEPAIGVVSPHAGYVYSGAVAGDVFSSVQVPGRAVIFCPNHTGLGEDVSVMSHGAWRMPWGDVPIDEELAARLETACPLLREDASAHLREHAIEVQLPFLHRFRPDVRIVPVALGRLSLEECPGKAGGGPGVELSGDGGHPHHAFMIQRVAGIWRLTAGGAMPIVSNLLYEGIRACTSGHPRFPGADWTCSHPGERRRSHAFSKGWTPPRCGSSGWSTRSCS